MSDRLVVAVESGFDNKVGVRLMITPQPYPGYATQAPFVCPPEEFPAWSVQQAVAKYGNLLRQKLTSAHPAVERALTDRLSARAGEVRPVVEILRGGRSKVVTKYSYDGLPHYGAYSHLRGEAVLARVDELLTAGTLRSTGGRFPKLEVA